MALCWASGGVHADAPSAVNAPARLVIYRDFVPGTSLATARITIDGHDVGTLDNGGVLIFDHAPAEVTVSAESPTDFGWYKMELPLNAGARYFLKVAPNTDGGGIAIAGLPGYKGVSIGRVLGYGGYSATASPDHSGAWMIDLANEEDVVPKLASLHDATSGNRITAASILSKPDTAPVPVAVASAPVTPPPAAAPVLAAVPPPAPAPPVAVAVTPAAPPPQIVQPAAPAPVVAAASPPAPPVAVAVAPSAPPPPVGTPVPPVAQPSPQIVQPAAPMAVATAPVATTMPPPAKPAGPPPAVAASDAPPVVSVAMLAAGAGSAPVHAASSPSAFPLIPFVPPSDEVVDKSTGIPASTQALIDQMTAVH